MNAARIRRAGAAVAAALMVIVVAGCGDEASPGASPSPAPVAETLPDATLASLTGGEPVELDALRGPMVINLWAQWCAPCRRELPIYQAFSEKYAGRVGVLGVDWQDVRADAARDLARESGVTYPLVVDNEPVLQARGLPRLILLDPQGRIAHDAYVEITSLGQLEDLVAEHLEIPG